MFIFLEMASSVKPIDKHGDGYHNRILDNRNVYDNDT